jgi:hypothetical protein
LEHCAVAAQVTSPKIDHAAAFSTCGKPMVDNKILFFHLPKTAGTALRNLFARHLGEEQVSKNLGLVPLKDSLIRNADLTAICGHFRARQGDLLPADRVSITVLRNPLDRFLSDFFFRKFDNHQRLIDQRVRALDIDAFIAQLSDNDADELNIQTTLLYPLGTAQLAALPWSEKAAAAKHALDQFDLVGVHAEIDDLVCMVCARMGWHDHAPLDRANVTSRRIPVDELSTRSRSKLDVLLAPDRSVFEHALARFKQLRRAAILTGPCATALPQTDSTALTAPPMQSATSSVLPAPREFGDRRLEITAVSVGGELSGPNEVLIGEKLNIHIDFIAHERVEEVSAGLSIHDERGVLVFGTNTYLLGDTYRVSRGTYSCRLAFIYRGEPGEFLVDVNLIRNGSHLEGCYHWKEQVARLYVSGSVATNFEGKVFMDASAGLVSVSPGGRVESERVAVHTTNNVLALGRLNPAITDHSAKITLLSEFREVPAGGELLVQIELKNTGAQTWWAHGKRPVNLSYHWHDRKGNVIEQDGLRTPLPRDVGPGESIRLPGLLRAPQRVGALRLTWTLVQEEVAWFDEHDRRAKSCVEVLVTQ